MAVEALTFPDPPTLTNGNDGNQDYNLGIRFSVDEATPCPGVRWIRTPDAITSTPNGGTHVAAIWTADTEIRVAFKNFTPTPATDNFDALFDTPIMLDPAPQLYVVSIFSRDYVYRASGGVEVVSPSGVMQADQGKLASNVNPLTFPASNQAAYYYVSPLVGTVDEEPEDRFTEGTAGLTLGAAAAVATSRTSSGSATLTATATAVRSTARATTGRAELVAGASAARSTVRTTSGVARLLLDAYGTQVRGGGGPRLVTVGRASRLTSVARPDAISTSTRG